MHFEGKNNFPKRLAEIKFGSQCEGWPRGLGAAWKFEKNRKQRVRDRKHFWRLDLLKTQKF